MSINDFFLFLVGNLDRTNDKIYLIPERYYPPQKGGGVKLKRHNGEIVRLIYTNAYFMGYVDITLCHLKFPEVTGGDEVDISSNIYFATSASKDFRYVANSKSKGDIDNLFNAKKITRMPFTIPGRKGSKTTVDMTDLLKAYVRDNIGVMRHIAIYITTEVDEHKEIHFESYRFQLYIAYKIKGK